MINEETEYTSLLETSFGYTGVNIKIPMNKVNIHIKSQQYRQKNISDWLRPLSTKKKPDSDHLLDPNSVKSRIQISIIFGLGSRFGSKN